jgi:hypothetical protein
MSWRKERWRASREKRRDWMVPWVRVWSSVRTTKKMVVRVRVIWAMADLHQVFVGENLNMMGKECGGSWRRRYRRKKDESRKARLGSLPVLKRRKVGDRTQVALGNSRRSPYMNVVGPIETELALSHHF